MRAAERLPILEPPITSAAAGVAAAVLLAAVPVAMAGPGDLDASFGEEGRAFIDFPNDDDVAATITLQADGRLVIGRENVAEADDFSVLRLNADGLPDMTFGREGRTTLDFQGIKGTTHVVLQQSDGSIVAAGTAQSTSGPDDADFGMARYNSDGSVDTGFGVDGVVLHNLGGQRDGINAIVQQADGRLIAAGYTDGSGGPSNSDMAFARFNADGSLDPSFGTNGSLVINFHGGNGPDEAGWLIQQPDGKLLAVGTAWPSNPSSSVDIGVVRLTPDGMPDTTFDGDGRAAVNLDVSRNWGSYFLEAAGVALQPDGRILLAGLTGYNVWDYGACLPVLARLNTDGSLDPSFGESGSVPIAIDGSCATFDELAIDPSGDVYAAGGAFHAYNGDLFVARVSASGNLDGSFGSAGLAIVDLGRARHASSLWYGSGGIVRQPDGRIVAVASTATSDSASGGDPQLVVARLLAEGNHPGVLGFRGDSWEFEGTLQVESETVGIVEIPVRRTGGSFGTVTIDYETASRSATSGTDFTGSAGTLTWADGDRTDKIISISIADDAEVEESESFRLTLSNPSGGATLATSEMMLLIESDESPSPEQPAPTSPPTGAPGAGGGSGAIGWEVLIAVALLLLHSRASKTRRGRATVSPATRS